MILARPKNPKKLCRFVCAIHAPEYSAVINFVQIQIHLGSMSLRDNLNWLLYFQQFESENGLDGPHSLRGAEALRKTKTLGERDNKFICAWSASLSTRCSDLYSCTEYVQPLIWYKLISIRQRRHSSIVHYMLFSTRIDRFGITKIVRLFIEAWQNVHSTIRCAVRWNRWAVACHVYVNTFNRTTNTHTQTPHAVRSVTLAHDTSV